MNALQGRCVGLQWPGWRNQPLSGETEALHRRAMDEVAARGATPVANPFRG